MESSSKFESLSVSTSKTNGREAMFNASNCSSVYSDNATTVTVDSLKVGMYIKF